MSGSFGLQTAFFQSNPQGLRRKKRELLRFFWVGWDRQVLERNFLQKAQTFAVRGLRPVPCGDLAEKVAFATRGAPSADQQAVVAPMGSTQDARAGPANQAPFRRRSFPELKDLGVRYCFAFFGAQNWPKTRPRSAGCRDLLACRPLFPDQIRRESGEKKGNCYGSNGLEKMYLESISLLKASNLCSSRSAARAVGGFGQKRLSQETAAPKRRTAANADIFWVSQGSLRETFFRE